ncbi:hypothetical protein CLF_101842 [Clonorchis sinensis]|uniref:Peptidase A1 domain-containing protein n=1 Tax=Clonorchis sinensis TaxID=79923 RepID=G7Y6P3_CLOSI|nr:hypothetical protein CLF_101842 [Clonorchis sinensis]
MTIYFNFLRTEAEKKTENCKELNICSAHYVIDYPEHNKRSRILVGESRSCAALPHTQILRRFCPQNQKASKSPMRCGIPRLWTTTTWLGEVLNCTKRVKISTCTMPLVDRRLLRRQRSKLQSDKLKLFNFFILGNRIIAIQIGEQNFSIHFDTRGETIWLPSNNSRSKEFENRQKYDKGSRTCP